MTVVSDTTTLNYLILIGLAEVRPQLFDSSSVSGTLGILDRAATRGLIDRVGAVEKPRPLLSVRRQGFSS